MVTTTRKLCVTLFIVAAFSTGQLRAADPVNTPDDLGESDVAAGDAEVNHNENELQRRSSRDSILEEFLKKNPEHPLQHWSAGFVWAGEQWLKHRLVIEQGEHWNDVYRYQQERDKRQDNFRDNLFLADGCREHGLRAEERAHLTRALLHDYSFHEAHRRLGHVNVNGFWITPRQIQLRMHESQRTQGNLDAWATRIQILAKKFAKTRPGSVAETKVSESLKEIRTPDAIPAVERYFASQGPRQTRAFQDWLATIDSHKAAEALVRQSVFHSTTELRTRAKNLLCERRYDQYVPYALSGLTSVNTRFSLELVQLPLALPTIPLRVFSKQVVVDGFDSTLTISGTRTVIKSEPFVPRFADRISVTGHSVPANQAPQILAQAYAGIGDVLLADYGQQTLESSQQIRIDRIVRMLKTATKVDIKDPEKWFDWWRKQNDLVLKNGKLKLNDEYDDGIWYVDNRRAQKIRISVRPVSCFVAGTLTETEHGPRPIEKIQIGDRVLTQDIETGELTFKPVLKRTVRKAAPTVILKTSSEEVHCSLGHPFWVSGIGWRMAKELEPGMSLYTLKGDSVDLQEIVPAEKETVYNLIVADFSTYFAGKQQFLTHDITPRESTDMVLPGIRKKFE